MKKRGLFRFGIVLVSLGAALVAASATTYYLLLPDVSSLTLQNPKTTAYIQRYVQRTSAKGKKPVIMMRWRTLGDISPYLKRAVIIAEDDAFYTHGGVDWDAIHKAFQYDRQKGRMLRGASTITQQVARNLYLSPERSILRKLKEMAIAFKLEQELTKDRILEIYLNIAEWGKEYTAQAASEIYFGKNAADLSPEEAAALAAALPSPWSRNPSHVTEKSPIFRKKEVILERMRKAGYLPPGVSEKEIEVPGAENPFPSTSSSPKPSLQSAPCDAPAALPSQPGMLPAPQTQEPPDSCGPQTPSLFGH